jgi:tetratricopeptide (TPR) repeat protein
MGQLLIDYELHFRVKLKDAAENEFQNLFTRIMGKVYGAEFQSVRPYGREGDWKCDGYLVQERDGVEEDVIFQVYAPPTGIKVKTTNRKIETDFIGAIEKWERCKRWIFVTNVSSGLPAPILKKLQGLQRKYREQGIEIEWWGIDEIVQEAMKLEISDRHALLGVYSDFIAGDKIWNLQHHRNPNFTGREAQLKRLNEVFWSEDCANGWQTIAGLGGVGKTQLAAEYAFRNRENYDIVWWLRSEEKDTLLTDYTALLEKIPELTKLNVTNQEEKLEAVYNWLSENKSWLLIFDNSKNWEDLLAFIPKAQLGHVLITSRNQNFPGKTLPLGVFDEEESTNFLLHRTQYESVEKGEVSVLQLAKELGHLPLALEHAAAYIKNKGRSFGEYLKLFQRYRLDLMKRVTPTADYKHTVLTTWTISFEEIGRESNAARLILKTLSFLAPDQIPRQFLSNIVECRHIDLENELDIDDAIEILRKYSFVELSPNINSLSLHRLLQEVVRNELSKQEKDTFAGIAAELVYLSFNYQVSEESSWTYCDQLLPHALLVVDFFINERMYQSTLVTLINNMGVYLLKHRADYARASYYLRYGLELGYKVYGSDSYEFSKILSNLGGVLYQQGLYEEAMIYCEHVVQITSRLNGYKLWQSQTIGYLGNLYTWMGRYEDAEKLLSESIRIAEELDEMDGEHWATTLNYYGYLYQAQYELPYALELYQLALGILTVHFGESHPLMASILSNIGTSYKDMGFYEPAVHHLKRAILIDQSVYGENHPSVGVIINNYADALYGLGDVSGAEESYKKALDIFIEFFGEGHEYTQNVKEKLR